MGSVLHEFAGGTVGGVMGMTIVYPLDTVKSRLQMSGRSKYTGMTHVFTSMIRNEGVFSLYRGLLSPVVGYGALFAISFSSYGFACRHLRRRRAAAEDSPLTLSEMAIAGAWAGIVNAPLRQVFERVKSVMQVRQGKAGSSPYSWSGACAVDLVRREGPVMGLGRGMVSTMLREPLQFAIYYPTVVKSWLVQSQPKAETQADPVWALMLAGGLAGCATWLPPVYFLDVLKTRMQTAAPGAYSSNWDCAVKTLRAEGVPVLFRGLGPSLLRAFPLHALIFLGFETTVSFLGNTPSPALIKSDGFESPDAETAVTR